MEGYCDICDGDCEVKMCCSGYECGCMGQPTEPPLCKGCADKYGDMVYCPDSDRAKFTYKQIILLLKIKIS